MRVIPIGLSRRARGHGTRVDIRSLTSLLSSEDEVVTLKSLTPNAAFGGGIDLRHSTRVLFDNPLGHWDARVWLAQRFAPPSAIVGKTIIQIAPIVRLNGVRIDFWIVRVIPPRLHTLTESLFGVPPPLYVWKMGSG